MLNLSLSCGHRRHQLFHAEDVERPAEIVDERRQAELTTHFFETACEESPLVHPLFDCTERMLNGIPAQIETLRPRFQPLRHAVERVLVFKARYGANIIRTARA